MKMFIGDIVESNGVEWSVVKVDSKGFPTSLRTTGRQRSIHLGSVFQSLDAVVKSKMYVVDDGFTQIDLFPPVAMPVYLAGTH